MNVPERIKEISEKLIILAATRLPDGVLLSLQEAAQKESNQTAKEQLVTILKNAEISSECGVSICQDPGVPVIDVTLGSDFPLKVDFQAIFQEVLAKVTASLPLRQNVVHPLSKQNSGSNTGWDIPYIFYDYSYGKDYLEMTVNFRGGGAAFRSGVVTVSPTMSRVKAVKKIVFDMVTMAGGIPCPPTTIGVGLGANPHVALKLAFDGLKRLPVGSHHPDPDMAELEDALTQTLNKSGIGPMGLGGDTTVMAVHVNYCGSHIASTPVAVAFSCWPNRFATVRLYKDGGVQWLTHKGVNQ